MKTPPKRSHTSDFGGEDVFALPPVVNRFSETLNLKGLRVKSSKLYANDTDTYP